jgi:hypothetical protein
VVRLHQLACAKVIGEKNFLEVLDMLYGMIRHTRTLKDGSKTVKYYWNWELCKYQLKEHWSSWYLRNIGLPLLMRRLIKTKQYAVQLATRVIDTEQAAKCRGTEWTPPAGLLEIIKSANSEAAAGR